MTTYTITHNPNAGGVFETSVQKDVSAGQAFKVLTYVIGGYDCEVVECTHTRVLIRTPNGYDYSHSFEGSEKEMQALTVFALHFQALPPERHYLKGMFTRALEQLRHALLNTTPEPGPIQKNAKRVQDQVRLMFRLDTETDADWPDQMRRVMAHLDAGKSVSALT